MKTIIASIIATFVIGLIATPAFAAKRVRNTNSYDSSAPTRSYIGGSVGQASTDSIALSNGKSSNAFSFMYGHEINNNFAAELSYSNFGSIDTQGNGTAVVKSTAYSLGVVGSVPISSYVSIFAKLGYASTTYTETGSATQNTAGNVTTGVGVNINATNKIVVRLAFDTYKLVDATTNEMINLRVPNVGVLFKF